MNGDYLVTLEISGPTAIFVRPDCGDSPVSYPAPTAAAVKGIFESVLRLESVEVIPHKVEICAPVVYHNYTTNYGGPLRKSGQIKGGNSYQLLATVLINVCYRLYAFSRNISKTRDLPLSNLAKQEQQKTTNPAHAYQAMFQRRLKRGQWFAVPCLGWREFVPDYLGEFRKQTKICDEINMTLPSMLKYTFEKGSHTKYSPVFSQNVHIRNGVLHYDE